MLGAVYRLTEAVPLALDCAQKAILFAEDIESPNADIKSNIILSLNNIGHVYRTLGEYDLAIIHFKESIGFEGELGNSLQLAMNYMAIGECLEAQRKLEEAHQNYEKALVFNEKIGSKRVHVISNLGIGHIHVHQGRTREALQIFESILELAESLGDMKIISQIFINIGWAHIQNNKFKEAGYNLNQGLELAKEYNLLSEMEEAYSFFSDLWEAQGNFKKSKEFFIQAKNIEDRISNDRNKRYVADLLALSESEIKGNQIEVLAKENEIMLLRLRRNQNTLLNKCFIIGPVYLSVIYPLQAKPTQKRKEDVNPGAEYAEEPDESAFLV